MTPDVAATLMRDRLARIVTCYEPVGAFDRCMLDPNHLYSCLPAPARVMLCEVCQARGCSECAGTGLGR